VSKMLREKTPPHWGAIKVGLWRPICLENPHLGSILVWFQVSDPLNLPQKSSWDWECLFLSADLI
jgi:hypothetical protein